MRGLGAVVFADSSARIDHGRGGQSLGDGAEVAGIDLAHRRQRGRVISGLHGVYTIGAAFSPYAGGLLTETFGFEAAFIGYSTATALSVAMGFAVPDVAVPRRRQRE